MKLHEPTHEVVRRYWKLSGKTQKEIGDKVGVSSSVINMYTKGTTKIPPTRAPELARQLGMNPLYLVKRRLVETQPELWDLFLDLFGPGIDMAAEPETTNKPLTLK